MGSSQIDNNNEDGILLSQLCPAYLHANSTSHTWVFSAIAELIDNAYDTGIQASEFKIDVEKISGMTCLTFTDNGCGMKPSQLHKMLRYMSLFLTGGPLTGMLCDLTWTNRSSYHLQLFYAIKLVAFRVFLAQPNGENPNSPSFGFCEKQTARGFKTVGKYGNGFKSGSMRLGRDVIVFTCCDEILSVGLLSQSYLEDIRAHSILVPIVQFVLRDARQLVLTEGNDALQAIMNHTIFTGLPMLLQQFLKMDCKRGGTRIIVYNLRKSSNDMFELDFQSDAEDILNSENIEIDEEYASMRVAAHIPLFRKSLREYCSILFLKPKMKIYIKNVKVKMKLISKTLLQKSVVKYQPTFLSPRAPPIKLIFGFSATDQDTGLMMYYHNRLIKAYEKVGPQKQMSAQAVGVVGVVEVDFLEPIHNKQDFEKSQRYNTFMFSIGIKLKHYWHDQGQMVNEERPSETWTWAQCDNLHCLKWRRLPPGEGGNLPEKWFCHMNLDPMHNRCEIEEEPEDEDALCSSARRRQRKRKESSTKKQQEKRNDVQMNESILKFFNVTKTSSTTFSDKNGTAGKIQVLEKSLNGRHEREEVQRVSSGSITQSIQMANSTVQNLPGTSRLSFTFLQDQVDTASSNISNSQPEAVDLPLTQNSTPIIKSEVKKRKKTPNEVICLDSDDSNDGNVIDEPSRVIAEPSRVIAEPSRVIAEPSRVIVVSPQVEDFTDATSTCFSVLSPLSFLSSSQFNNRVYDSSPERSPYVELDIASPEKSEVNVFPTCQKSSEVTPQTPGPSTSASSLTRGQNPKSKQKKLSLNRKLDFGKKPSMEIDMNCNSESDFEIEPVKKKAVNKKNTDGSQAALNRMRGNVFKLLKFVMPNHPVFCSGETVFLESVDKILEELVENLDSDVQQLSLTSS